MRKFRVLLLAVLVIGLLTACGGAAEDAPSTTTPTTVPTEPPLADIGGTQLDLDVTRLDLSSGAFELDKLIKAADLLQHVTYIDLGVTEMDAEQLESLQSAYPEARIDYSISLFGKTVSNFARYLDASAMAAARTDALLEALPMLPMLEEINFVSEDGVCVYTIEQLDQLEEVKQALPEAKLRVSFDLFGQTVTSEDERIEYFRVEIGNEGVEQIRAVLPYLSSCTYFLMDGCGVDNEVMAQLREDNPQTKVVWRIWLVDEPAYNIPKLLRGASLLTDTYRVRTTYVNDRNSHLLNYCTETKYVDVGHVWDLRQCEFLTYMPDLEVCILAISGITDITPLANHEKLEYLELFTTDIENISALASCPNLEHLNLANMPKLNDITPLYGLTKLKRLRMVTSPLIPQEQKDEIEELLPDCEMLDRGYFPTAGLWRYSDPAGTIKQPRYELLCQQMEYSIDAHYGIP